MSVWMFEGENCTTPISTTATKNRSHSLPMSFMVRLPHAGKKSVVPCRSFGRKLHVVKLKTRDRAVGLSDGSVRDLAVLSGKCKFRQIVGKRSVFGRQDERIRVVFFRTEIGRASCRERV